MKEFGTLYPMIVLYEMKLVMFYNFQVLYFEYAVENSIIVQKWHTVDALQGLRITEVYTGTRFRTEYILFTWHVHGKAVRQ